MNIFGVNISVYLYNLPEKDLTEVILGRRPDLEISDDQCGRRFLQRVQNASK